MNDYKEIAVRNVTKDLKRDFKTWCASKRISMSDACIVLIGIALRKDLQGMYEKNEKRKALERKNKAQGKGE